MEAVVKETGTERLFINEVGQIITKELHVVDDEGIEDEFV